MADLCALACLYLFARVYQALSLESTFSNGDSASGEQCGSVARYGKGTNTKFANLYHNAQSSHSPTANLRILEKENNQTELESNKLDSSVQVDCHATASAVSRNDSKNTICKKVDSRSEVQILNNSAQDPREMVAA
ncbi:hypothetical protein [Helicobacter canis]|uniref:Glycosyltransferase n=1 Tax=Helicobacter canis TaxID=29419 RepID=A0A377J490_9HELI|nr:hypothetical protein [Helicobacter canis]STO97302.1 glycosyltransferase [Helicobacter canis]